eukprot:2254729-Karenia_brevis.AAC.1
MGADAVATTKQGRCLITSITVAKGIKWDPWVMGPVNPLGEQWITSQWGLDHAPNPWLRGATQMHLKEMGWKVQWHSGAL